MRPIRDRVYTKLRLKMKLQGMHAGHKAVYDCIKAFPETNSLQEL